jgi:hypothetical protein
MSKLKHISRLFGWYLILPSIFVYSCGRIEENEPHVIHGLTNDLYEQYKNCQNNEKPISNNMEPSLTTNSIHNEPDEILPGMPYYCNGHRYPPSIVYNSNGCKRFLRFFYMTDMD